MIFVSLIFRNNPRHVIFSHQTGRLRRPPGQTANPSVRRAILGNPQIFGSAGPVNSMKMFQNTEKTGHSLILRRQPIRIFQFFQFSGALDKFRQEFHWILCIILLVPCYILCFTGKDDMT